MTARNWTQFINNQESMTSRLRVRALTGRMRSWEFWLVAAIYVGCVVAFVADLTSANTLAFGVFYAPLIVTAVFYQNRHAVWLLTAVACAMVVAGSLFPAVAFDVKELVVNRVLSIVALLATAAFTWHAREIQDQLAGQKKRAEAAEHIKSEVLINLSQEIRAPLHSMVGVLELLAADRREQSAALSMVRGAGRRLAATVDNLVDLTQFDDRPMPTEPIDLGLLLRQTAEANRGDAAARQISLSIDIPPHTDALVQVNLWAVRRILENKIADAIIYTPPGGRIEIGIESGPGHRTVAINASGSWPPNALRSASDTNSALLMPTVMGLALSQRLARAMGARLTFANAPVEGTMVRLRLPSAGPEAGDA